MPGWWGGSLAFFSFFEYIQQVMIFLGNRVPNILVLIIFLVFYRQLGANVDCFVVNFVVEFVPS